MFRRYFRPTLLASSSVFVNEVSQARPPGPDNLPLPVDIDDIFSLDPGPLPLSGGLPIGSNMHSLEPDATSKESLRMGNPQFPWTGTERLYLTHL